MRGKLAHTLTTKRALVVIVGVLLALAWAIPSIGAGTASVARKAFARANLAIYHSNLALDTSNKAKTTANQASANADSAKTAASQAQSTANSALTKARFQDNFTATVDPGNIASTACTGSSIARAGVVATDEVLVTPPDTQPIGIVTQAFTAGGQVTLEFCNVTGSPIDPPSGAYEFSTIR